MQASATETEVPHVDECDFCAKCIADAAQSPLGSERRELLRGVADSSGEGTLGSGGRAWLASGGARALLVDAFEDPDLPVHMRASAYKIGGSDKARMGVAW
eukprot:359877-Chlamydomonas_euryale.AAC.2